MTTTYNSVSEYEFYKAGTIDPGTIVGYSGGNRVLRYQFVAPADGSSGFSFAKKNVGDEGGVAAGATLHWYVSTDPDGYKNAGPENEYHGEIILSDKDGEQYTATGGTENLILLPGETYYLFIFPGTSVKKYYWWNYPTKITLTLTGSAGLVRIGSGATVKNALPHVYTGGSGKSVIPYIRKGAEWKICS